MGLPQEDEHGKDEEREWVRLVDTTSAAASLEHRSRSRPLAEVGVFPRTPHAAEHVDGVLVVVQLVRKRERTLDLLTLVVGHSPSRLKLQDGSLVISRLPRTPFIGIDVASKEA